MELMLITNEKAILSMVHLFCRERHPLHCTNHTQLYSMHAKMSQCAGIGRGTLGFSPPSGGRGACPQTGMLVHVVIPPIPPLRKKCFIYWCSHTWHHSVISCYAHLLYDNALTCTTSLEKLRVSLRSVPLELVHLISRLLLHTPPILPGGISLLGDRWKSTFWKRHKKIDG